MSDVEMQLAMALHERQNARDELAALRAKLGEVEKSLSYIRGLHAASAELAGADYEAYQDETPSLIARMFKDAEAQRDEAKARALQAWSDADRAIAEEVERRVAEISRNPDNEIARLAAAKNTFRDQRNALEAERNLLREQLAKARSRGDDKEIAEAKRDEALAELAAYKAMAETEHVVALTDRCNALMTERDLLASRLRDLLNDKGSNAPQSMASLAAWLELAHQERDHAKAQRDEAVRLLRIARSYVSLTDHEGRSPAELAEEYPHAALVVEDLRQDIDALLAKAGK